MTDRRRPLSASMLTLASVALLGACVVEPDPILDDDGIAFDEEGETEGPTTGDGDGDTDTDTTGDGDGDGDPDPTGDGDGDPPTCETTTATANNVPPNVMLVLDKSRSMVNYSWDDDGDSQTPEVTRWSSLHGTVDTITSQYELGMSLGLTLFPSTEATSNFNEACLVSEIPEVGAGLGNAQAILAAIPAADALNLYGATPAAAGVVTALAHLEGLADGNPAAMILVTDGAANCGLGNGGSDLFNLYDDDLPLIVADAWERAGIPTYVIGIDISSESVSPFTNPREKLDEVAQLGGVAQAGEVGFYDATNADALLSALDDIAASVSCNVTLGEAPSGPDELLISIDGETIPRLDSCEDGDGWVYQNPDGPLDRIELCNAACDALLDVGEVEAEFLCPPQP